MPKRRPRSQFSLPVRRPPAVVVVDHSLSSILGLPRIKEAHGSIDEVNAHLVRQAMALAAHPVWQNVFRSWALEHMPTFICLSPDTILDSVLFAGSIAPQSYGFGTPAHVPALFKPNGSINWLRAPEGAMSSSVRAIYKLHASGIVLPAADATAPLPNLPGTLPWVSPDNAPEGLFRTIRTEGRRRLREASDILLLGLEPTQLNTLDTLMLSGLQPSKRLTIVSRTSTVASVLRDRCKLEGKFDLRRGDLDEWIETSIRDWNAG